MDPEEKKRADDKLIELILQSAKNMSWRESLREPTFTPGGNPPGQAMLGRSRNIESSPPRCNCGFGGFHEPTNQRCDLTQWEQDQDDVGPDAYADLVEAVAGLADQFSVPSDRRSDFTVSILALLGHEGMRQTMHATMSNQISLTLVSRLKAVLEKKEAEGDVVKRNDLRGSRTYYLLSKQELFRLAKEAKDLG